MRFAVCTMAILATVIPNRVMAQARWIKARLGPFEAISDDGRRPATQALNQFAQFSFALGTAMGQPELRLDPPLRIIVFKNAQELAGRLDNNRIVNFAGLPGMLGRFVDVEITAVWSYTLRGELVPGQP